MAFVAGLVGGLSSSMPIGPINLILLDLVSRRSAVALAFVFGVCLADGLLAALTLWGSLHVLLEPRLALGLGAVCAGLLLVYGLLSWRARPAAGAPRTATLMLPAAGLGFALCVFNPLFTLFWVSYILAYKEIFATSEIGIPGFVGGVVSGDLIWFAVIGVVAVRVLTRRGPRFLDRLRRATSILILLFSGYLFTVVLLRAFDV